MYEREDWTSFRTLEGLTRKAGVSADQLPAIVVKELTDNALDAAGMCSVQFFASDCRVEITDRGDGLPGDDEAVAKIYSVNRPLTSSKLLRRPSRGALGNGLRVVTGAVLATEGELTVATRGRVLRLTPQFATGETQVERVGDFDERGTKIIIRLGPPLVFQYQSLKWARTAIQLAGSNGLTYSGRPSAHWYDPDSFFELLQAAGPQTIRQVVEEFDGCKEPKAGQLTKEFGKNRLASDLTKGEAEQLRLVMLEKARPVTAKRLGFVGPAEGMPAAYARVEGGFLIPSIRSDVTKIPCVVEAWAEAAEEDSAELFVNRSPSVATLEGYHHDDGEFTLAGCGIHVGVTATRKKFRLCLNVETPCIPIVSEGKAPDLAPFTRLVVAAADKAITRAKRLRRSGVTVSLDSVKRNQKEAILGCLQRSVNKVGGGRRYTQRQLFYTARDLVKLVYGVAEPTWGYFCRVITDHEAKLGHDLPGITRDNRGILYHPHEGREIPLGTLTVEAYERQAWMFNKVLYCEKEGFFPLLKDVGWPERNDCALLTSKGFASRAARDVIDLLGDTDEELLFFCVHDADSYGTMIYQALQGATTARPGRRVRIINLGLEPAEAVAMGLPVEPVERKKKKKRDPVAKYVPASWAEWLQTKRVELNAMTSPQFLDWLDSKVAPYAKKIIPPADVMTVRFRTDVRSHLEEQIRARILREAGFQEQVQDTLRKCEAAIISQASMLQHEVEQVLSNDPMQLWSAPVNARAQALAREAS